MDDLIKIWVGGIKNKRSLHHVTLRYILHDEKDHNKDVKNLSEKLW
jgi:hypothetical protein